MTCREFARPLVAWRDQDIYTQRGRREGMLEAATKSAVRSIVRGLLGGLFGGGRR